MAVPYLCIREGTSMAPNDYLPPRAHRGLRKRTGSHVATRTAILVTERRNGRVGDISEMRTRARRDAGIRLTAMTMGLLPTLAFSDPRCDPHWAGRGWIPVDGNASIGLPVSSGWTATDVRGPP
jgi:hypothetical protein